MAMGRVIDDRNFQFIVRPKPNRTRQVEGWIYVLSDNLGHFKIGKAEKLDQRIKRLRIQLPFPVVVEYCFQSSNCHQVERELHRRLAKQRINGEWFTLDLDDLANITAYANCAGWYENTAGELVRDPLWGCGDNSQDDEFFEAGNTAVDWEEYQFDLLFRKSLKHEESLHVLNRERV